MNEYRIPCSRCGKWGHEPDDAVRMRVLWPTAPRVVHPSVPLCDDCNDVVQGPDHVNLAGNVPVDEPGWYCVAADCGRRFNTREERAAHTRETHVVRTHAYVCSVCDKPIIDEDPHSTPEGEDCHAGCCSTCRWAPPTTPRNPEGSPPQWVGAPWCVGRTLRSLGKYYSTDPEGYDPDGLRNVLPPRHI